MIYAYLTIPGKVVRRSTSQSDLRLKFIKNHHTPGRIDIEIPGVINKPQFCLEVIVFEISFPTYARVYEGPSFKSRRLGFREDLGILDVLGDSPEGWLVVRSVNTGRTRYVPADDAKYYKLDRKGRRKGQVPARPQVK